jgi:hypothetical protein
MFGETLPKKYVVARLNRRAGITVNSPCAITSFYYEKPEEQNSSERKKRGPAPTKWEPGSVICFEN